MYITFEVCAAILIVFIMWVGHIHNQKNMGGVTLIVWPHWSGLQSPPPLHALFLGTHLLPWDSDLEKSLTEGTSRFWFTDLFFILRAIAWCTGQLSWTAHRYKGAQSFYIFLCIHSFRKYSTTLFGTHLLHKIKHGCCTCFSQYLDLRVRVFLAFHFSQTLWCPWNGVRCQWNLGIQHVYLLKALVLLIFEVLHCSLGRSCHKVQSTFLSKNLIKQLASFKLILRKVAHGLYGFYNALKRLVASSVRYSHLKITNAMITLVVLTGIT